MSFVVREYVDDSGRIPFRDWLSDLDVAIRARIQARILRFETGKPGRPQGGRRWRLGSATRLRSRLRLYFGRSGREVVLLLLGGDKRSQNKDIKRAREFWASYVKEVKHGKTQ